ncbi:hypothetical protein MKP05_21020 [Halomonas sp. EGI 63088]|uniref:Transposase n=1 Tax=Halomonas flagellata TaxID=2920385 RepID=A0ABS9S0H6_9GAMM|nr:hypothetical protein [Halomonas flagellata]MCH4565579.1 hypothetical protein [Halomonas flagellata]
MLQERTGQWPQRWKQEGRQEGREEGRQEALKEAEARIQEARLEAKRETACNLIETTNLDNVTIANATGLSEDEVRELRSTH